MYFHFLRDDGFAATAHVATPDRKLHTYEDKGDFANMQKDRTLGLIKVLREANAFDRCDNKEVLNLTEVYLNAHVSYNFQKPGAVHKACWMAKQAYCFKIVMLQLSHIVIYQ